MSDQWGAPGGPPQDPGPTGPPGAFPPPGPHPATPPPGTYQPTDGYPPAGAYPPAGGQPAAGWEPPPAVYQQYAPGPAPGSSGAPEGLKILTIVLTVVKAVPLAIMLIGLFFLIDAGDEFNDVPGFGTVDEAVTALVLVILVFLVVGALLLFFHVRSVLKSQMLALAVTAGIMCLIDLLFLLGSLGGGEDNVFGILLMLVVLAAQATIFGWALKARNANPF